MALINCVHMLELKKPRKYMIYDSSFGNTPTIDWSNNRPSIKAPVNFDERIIGIAMPFLKIELRVLESAFLLVL